MKSLSGALAGSTPEPIHDETVMPDFFNDPMIGAGVGLLVLAGLSAIAFYVVSSFRDYAADDREDTEELLANLREMHLRGDISDEEFRTIQTANHPHHDDAADESESDSDDDDPASN